MRANNIGLQLKYDNEACVSAVPRGHELNYSLNYYFAQLDHTVEPLNDV